MRVATLVFALLVGAGPLFAQPADLFRGEPGRIFLDAMATLREAEGTSPGAAQAALLDEVAARLEAIRTRHPDAPLARALASGEPVGQFNPRQFQLARLSAAGPEAVRSLLLEHAAARAGNDSYCRAVTDRIAGLPANPTVTSENPRLHAGQEPFLLPVVALLSRQAPKAAWRVVTLDPSPDEAFEVMAAATHFLHDFGGTPPSFQTPFALLALRSLQALAAANGVEAPGSGLWLSPWRPPGDDQRLETRAQIRAMSGLWETAHVQLLEALFVRAYSPEAVVEAVRSAVRRQPDGRVSLVRLWSDLRMLGFWRDEDVPALRILLEALAELRREVPADAFGILNPVPGWLYRAVDRPTAARDEMIGWLLEEMPNSIWWQDPNLLDWALRFGWLAGPRVQGALAAGRTPAAQALRLPAAASLAERAGDRASALALIAETDRGLETLAITPEEREAIREGLRRMLEPLPPDVALLQGAREDAGSLLHHHPRFLAPADPEAALPALLDMSIERRRGVAEHLARGYLLVGRPGDALGLVRAFDDAADRADLLARLSIDRFALRLGPDALEVARQASQERTGSPSRPPLPGVALALAGDPAGAAAWVLGGPLAQDCRALTMVSAAMASTR